MTLPSGLGQVFSHQPQLLSEKQVAAITGQSIRTLQGMRARKVGPCFHKLGRSVKYSLDDVQTWLASNRHGSVHGER